MIRLYLKNYKAVEIDQLYNALCLAYSIVKEDASANPCKDLEEALVYLNGFMDATEGDSVKWFRLQP